MCTNHLCRWLVGSYPLSGVVVTGVAGQGGGRAGLGGTLHQVPREAGRPAALPDTHERGAAGVSPGHQQPPAPPWSTSCCQYTKYIQLVQWFVVS